LALAGGPCYKQCYCDGIAALSGALHGSLAAGAVHEVGMDVHLVLDAWGKLRAGGEHGCALGVGCPGAGKKKNMDLHFALLQSARLQFAPGMECM